MREPSLHERLEALAEAVDTRFEGVEGEYRALIVLNPTEVPYTGVVVLRVDMPLKPEAQPRHAAVWTPDGVRVPCQIINSQLEPVSEWRLPDGRVRLMPMGTRRWRFDLAFWVEAVPARGYRVYRAQWSEDELPLPQVPTTEPPVLVREALPHAGTLGKEGQAW